MTQSSTQLSDKALGVFAFAAYHQLSSGEPVSRVVRHDGAGHKADPEAVRELEERGLAKSEDDRITFTPEGLAMLARVVDALHGVN